MIDTTAATAALTTALAYEDAMSAQMRDDYNTVLIVLAVFATMLCVIAAVLAFL